MSRFEQLVSNVRFNIYGQIFQSLIPFFAVPFLLHHLGNEAYALYALIGILTGQMGLLHFGAGTANIKYLAQFNALQDRTRAQRLMGNSLIFYAGMGLLGTVAVLVLRPYLHRFFNVSPALAAAADFVFLCTGLIFLIQSLTRIFQAVPQALQRFDYVNIVETVTMLVFYGGSCWLVYAGHWVRAIALWNMVVAVGALALYVYVAGRLMPGATFRPSYDPESMRQLMSLSSLFFVLQVCWSIVNQADKLALAHLSSLREMTYYLIASSLAQKLPALINPIQQIVMPLASALQSHRDMAAACRLYRTGTKLTVILLWPAAMAAFFFGPTILGLWLGAEYSLYGGWVLRWLVLGSFMSALSAFSHQISQGFGRVKVPAVLFSAHTLMTLVLWVMVIPRYGALGAAWVFFGIQASFGGLILWWFHKSVLGLPLRDMKHILAVPLGLSLPIIIFDMVLRNALHGWIALIASVLFSYVLYGALCYRFALSAEETARLDELLKRSPAH